MEVDERVQAAITPLFQGRRAEARAACAALWEVLPAADAMARCVLAHHAADAEDDPRAALVWDQRALAEARRLPAAEVATFWPSLHLNLADGYRQVGELDLARAAIADAQATLEALPDDGYGRMIRGGVARLAGELDAQRAEPRPI